MFFFGWEDNLYWFLVEFCVGDFKGEFYGIDLFFSVLIGVMEFVFDGKVVVGWFCLVM